MEAPFLSLVLSCLVFSGAAASSDTLVLDKDGNPVLRGEPYYVFAAQIGENNNLGMLSLDGLCPLNVMLKPFPPPDPVTFTPFEVRTDRTVLLEELLYIMFSEPSQCPESTQWMVNDTTGFITTGGETTPSDRVYNYYDFFRVVPYEIPGGPGYYQLYSCPTLVEERPCSSIGESRGSQIGRSSLPLLVQFEKQPEAARSKKVPEQRLMRPTAQRTAGVVRSM